MTARAETNSKRYKSRGICLLKQNVCAMFLHEQDRLHALVGARLLGERKRGFETFRAQPSTRVEAEQIFFIWIGRNALKSPDSDE
jgi:hypothetical protein